MQCSTVQGSSVQFSAVQFSLVQRKVVQCRLRPKSLKHSSSVEVTAVQYCPVKCISLGHDPGNVCTLRCIKLIQQFNNSFEKNWSLLSCTAKQCTVMHCTRHSRTWCTTRYLSPNSNITKLAFLHLECAKVWFCVLCSLWFIYSIYVDISTTNAVQCNAVQLNVQCSAVQLKLVQCSTLQCSAVHCTAVLQNLVQVSWVWFSAWLNPTVYV